MRWRLLLDPGGPSPEDGPANMATDAALLESVRAGAPATLRLYRWDPPTLSFGRNQPAAGLYDEGAARDRGIAFVRRPTGGQAVLHADELTYAVVAPIEVIGRPREAYRRINEALVAGLIAIGVEARVAGAAGPVGAPGADVGDVGGAVGPGAGPDWSRACFRAPAEGEVVVRGRKLVGSAQRREGAVILQHGSLLLGGSQWPAEALLRGPPGPTAGPPPRPRDVAGAPPEAGWTTLDEELPARPGWCALADALVAGFAGTLGTALAPAGLSVEETARVQRLREKFADPEWTWRR